MGQQTDNYILGVDMCVQEIDNQIICQCYVLGKKNTEDYIRVEFPFSEFKKSVLSENGKVEITNFPEADETTFIPFNDWWTPKSKLQKCKEYETFINKRDNRTTLYKN